MLNASKLTDNILPLKKREEIIDAWLKTRMETVLVEAMKKEDIPMWIIVSREYNEDPVLRTLTPRFYDSSRRLSIFVFVQNTADGKLERYFIGSPHEALQDDYQFILDSGKETHWQALKALVEKKNPSRIAINKSPNIAVADGLTSNHFDLLKKELGDEWSQRFVSSEDIVVHWLLKRTDEEMLTYPFLADLTSELCKTALSKEVIYPGITTTTNVVDWIRQKVLDLGLETSFYPTVDIQRKGEKIDRLSGVPILPGDIVHLDFGIDYLGLCTDTQQLAYVLKAGETDAPEGLKKAFKDALVMEDIVIEQLRPGKTGNDVFEECLSLAAEKSLDAMLYSHPIGYHCHEAGPIVGLYDQQKRIPVKGDYEVVENSAYALEFNIHAYIPEWEQKTYIYLEQSIAVYKKFTDYLTPRQEEFYLI